MVIDSKKSTLLLILTMKKKRIITNNTLQNMIHTVDEYQKWIRLESKKDEKEMSIFQVGKLNPKNELMKNIEEYSTTSISQSLNVLVKHDVF